MSIGLILLATATAAGQEVRRGERPVIDLERIPDEAIEAGKMRIRLHVSHQEALDARPVEVKADGQVVFGIEGVDALNRRFGVQDAAQTFGLVLANKAFSARHRARELHLWYDLYLDRDADVREMVKAYLSLPEVAHAEPVFVKMLIGHVEEDSGSRDEDPGDWFPNDPQFGAQWHYHNTGQQGGTPGADISLPGAWALERGSPEVVIAVIDGGIDTNHPDLAPNMWPGIGYNFVNNTPTIVPHNHGTHVAGTIAAASNNAQGVSGIAGGWGDAPGVGLMSLQVFTESSSGGFTLAPVWGADNGAAISQNSWGYRFQNTFEQAVLDAIDYFNANAGGEVMDGGLTIFAAGNSNSGGNWYPGVYSGAMAVAATNNMDQKAWYSNYDTWVEISAPGGETNTVTQRGVLSTTNNNSYAHYQGTSMACPHVSGVAALLLSAHPGVFSAEELRQILIHSADDHYAVNPSFVGRLGSGRLNALAALEMAPVFLAMPKRPENFTATVMGTTQVDLAWDLNDDNDPVLLVYSQDGILGSPENGVTYSPGDMLPGGGEVLLTGTATSFEHSGLEPGDYYHYRIWSVNDEQLYSLPAPALLAITDCELFDALPFHETFPVAMTPACWLVSDHQGNGQVWQFGTFSAGLQGTTGNYAFLNSDGYGSGNTQNADLLSPVFDLSNYSEVSLSFTHFFRSFTNSAGTLSLSIDGGETWEQLRQWVTTTTNPATVTFNLDHAAGSASVRLKWNYTGTWGYYWCVDDVVLSGVPAIPGAPVVQTLAADAVSFDTATLHANLVDDGDEPVTAAGFVVSTQPMPELDTPGVLHVSVGALESAGPFSAEVTGLQNATRYYVRAYAENNIALIYGPQVQFTTLCDIFGLPFAEGFDEPDIPHCWEVVDHQGNGQVWTVGSFSAGLQGGAGNYAYLNSDGFGSGNSQNTDLISPAISITGMDALEVSFTHFFRQWSSSSGTFFYSLDGGNQWTQVQQWTGSNTANPAHFSMELTGLSGAEQLLLKWNYTGTWGYYWCIDDILVTPLNVQYHSLEMAVSGAGTTSPAVGSHSMMEGETITLEAFPADGWEFDKWVVNGEDLISANPTEIVMDGPKDVTAVFVEVIPEYTLTILVQGHGTTTPPEGTHVYPEGSEVDLAAEPLEGWMFEKWVIGEDNEVESPQYTLPVMADLTATAVFVEMVPEYTVIIAVDGEGTVSPAPGEYEYEEGSALVLTATPNPEWIFSEWMINGEPFTDNPYELTVSGDLQVVAHFSSTVGVAMPHGALDVKVYPNPGRERFYVAIGANVERVEISLLDIRGQVVLAPEEFAVDGTSSLELPVPGLGQGVYFIRIISALGVHLEKVVVQ
jgi:subtilisin family serine protease